MPIPVLYYLCKHEELYGALAQRPFFKWVTSLEHGGFRKALSLHRHTFLRVSMVAVTACALYGKMGNCYTVAQCEAMVMCNNNHWIITPILT